MKRLSKPSPAMVVAVISLIVAIGGTAVALPGRRTVGNDDMKTQSVGARSLGKVLVGQVAVLASSDPVAKDAVFTEAEGTIRCPAKAPFAFDPSIGKMGPQAYEVRSTVITSRFGGPVGYTFHILTDEGPSVGYTMKVNCLLRR